MGSNCELSLPLSQSWIIRIIIFGCLLVAALAQAVPAVTMLWVGLVAVLVGILWIQRNYAIYQACMSFLVVALFGDLHRDHFIDWAGRRLADTLIGVAIAVIAYYLAVLLPERVGNNDAPAS